MVRSKYTKLVASLVPTIPTNSGTSIQAINRKLVSIPASSRSSWLCIPTGKETCNHVISVLGDFNARVGADCPALEGVLGRHGVGQCISNGQLLLQTCMAYNLHITNSNFQLHLKNRTSWMHLNTGI